MPVALILALLSALPSLLPGVEGLVETVTAGVKQGGKFTPEQHEAAHQLTLLLNQRAADLEKQRTGG